MAVSEGGKNGQAEMASPEVDSDKNNSVKGQRRGAKRPSKMSHPEEKGKGKGRKWEERAEAKGPKRGMYQNFAQWRFLRFSEENRTKTRGGTGTQKGKGSLVGGTERNDPAQCPEERTRSR